MRRLFCKSEKLAYGRRNNIIANRDYRNQHGIENYRTDSENDTTCCPEDSKAKKHPYDGFFIQQKKNLLKDALDSISTAIFGFVLLFTLSYFLYSPSFYDFLYLALWGGAISFDPINVTVPLLFWVVVNSFVLGIAKLLVCFTVQKSHLVMVECRIVKGEGWNWEDGWETNIEYRIPSRWDNVSGIIGMLLPIFALLIWPWREGHFNTGVFCLSFLMLFLYLMIKEEPVSL